MKHIVKQIAAKSLKPFGLQISRRKGSTTDAYATQAHLFDLIARHCSTIFDVGAHHGWVTLRFRELFPDSAIHSFEPFPDSFSKLRERVQCDRKIVANEICISDDISEKKFYVNHFDATNSLYPRPTKGKRYYPQKAIKKTEILVPSTTIDIYMQENSVDIVDILKMDIQGGELTALKGANKALQEERIGLIYTEAMYISHYEGSPLMYEIWNYLSEFQYTLFNIYNNKTATDGQLRQGDAIFLSPDFRRRFENATKYE